MDTKLLTSSNQDSSDSDGYQGKKARKAKIIKKKAKETEQKS